MPEKAPRELTIEAACSRHIHIRQIITDAYGHARSAFGPPRCRTINPRGSRREVVAGLTKTNGQLATPSPRHPLFVWRKCARRLARRAGGRGRLLEPGLRPKGRKSSR